MSSPSQRGLPWHFMNHHPPPRRLPATHTSHPSLLFFFPEHTVKFTSLLCLLFIICLPCENEQEFCVFFHWRVPSVCMPAWHLVGVRKNISFLHERMNTWLLLCFCFVLSVLRFWWVRRECMFIYPAADSLRILNRKTAIYYQFWKILSHYTFKQFTLQPRFFHCILLEHQLDDIILLIQSSCLFKSFFYSDLFFLCMSRGNFFHSIFEVTNSVFRQVSAAVSPTIKALIPLASFPQVCLVLFQIWSFWIVLC